MTRVATTTLLLGGALLLATWLVAPAASSATTQESAAPAADRNEVPPEVAAVSREVDRLRRSMPAPDELTAPARDPFSFGERARARTPNPAERARPAAPVFVPVLPSLVAILSSTVDGAVVRTAVLSSENDVVLVVPGDRVGDLRVASVTARDVVLVAGDAPDHSFTLSLH
jgi:hypothetical protein